MPPQGSPSHHHHYSAARQKINLKELHTKKISEVAFMTNYITTSKDREKSSPQDFGNERERFLHIIGGH